MKSSDRRLVFGSDRRSDSLQGGKLEELLRLYFTKPYSLRKLAAMFGVSRMTVWRAVQDAKAFYR